VEGPRVQMKRNDVSKRPASVTCAPSAECKDGMREVQSAVYLGDFPSDPLWKLKNNEKRQINPKSKGAGQA